MRGKSENSLLEYEDYKDVRRRLDRSTEEEVDILVTSQIRRAKWQTVVDDAASEPTAQIITIVVSITL